VWIKNETTLSVDGAALLESPPVIPLADDGPQIFIVHTHGSEAYWPDEEYPYTPTDVERTEDTRFNVVRVGDEMQAVFERMGLRVLHDRNIYDQPSYNGSYGRSLTAIATALKENPGISVVIDLHRDSIQTADGTNYKTAALVDGQKMAQAMIVVGTNDSGLDHPNWKQNLAFAMGLQQRVNTAYPGLMRPINLRRERFNAHATTGSILLEVGSSANTLGEAIETAKRFAIVMGTYLIDN
jgi:stage II sporulation protein P